jgi:hypothetical protein
MRAYADDDGNTYRVEQASNKRHVTVRWNEGGNMKRFKPIDDAGSRDNAQKLLDGHAKANGWKETT